jgi:NAD(P)-dependent dehydrogenase (short-subunit alcohol dehydrogenase family)
MQPPAEPAKDKTPGSISADRLPSFRLDGRIAVVTGASEGIGRTFASAFAAAGAHVIAAARRAEKLEEVTAEIGAAGGSADAVVTDVTNSQDLRRLVDAVRDRAGQEASPIVLVNNAGFGFTKPALETSEEEWDALFRIHVKATFFASQAFATLMIERGYGKIVNMSSTWSQSTDIGKAAYAAAKGAVSRITASLSTEWAPLGIRVNALAPTTTATDFTTRAMQANPDRAARLLSRIKLGRYAETSDLVGPALFLASEASDFVTGHTLFVDGGWHAGG